ncbi:hypothetical protein OGAPHI_000130 [Ogataea philodendri]|uniref:Uncharacterized protein n=1 Tax=Ogataea philodendri TaxID=1378263 RepID=A0A9P8TAT5_9ASCO|nr:uncharacterized protein OGAPHI_000130 [Ogataea philodendri]KAH3671944.1 hypothetical protein OGAPHI_000130 [Ogataea philodendri]
MLTLPGRVDPPKVVEVNDVMSEFCLWYPGFIGEEAWEPGLLDWIDCVSLNWLGGFKELPFLFRSIDDFFLPPNFLISPPPTEPIAPAPAPTAPTPAPIPAPIAPAPAPTAPAPACPTKPAAPPTSFNGAPASPASSPDSESSGLMYLGSKYPSKITDP